MTKDSFLLIETEMKLETSCFLSFDGLPKNSQRKI